MLPLHQDASSSCRFGYQARRYILSKMKKPPPTKRQVQRFIMTSRQKTRMELVLDFDRPVSVLVAREAVRKIIDHLDLVIQDIDLPEELGEASLKCAEMKRVVQIECRSST